MRTFGGRCSLAKMKKLTIAIAVLLVGCDGSSPSNLREAMGNGHARLVPLGTNESVTIAIPSNAKGASSLSLEFRPDGIILAEARDAIGRLVKAERFRSASSQTSALRARFAVFRPPSGKEDFLPRGCSYTYDASDTVTLVFANIAIDRKGADQIKFVHFQTTCQNRWAELGLMEIRAIIASLPQTALIRSRVL